jgi:hypothetical protein
MKSFSYTSLAKHKSHVKTYSLRINNTAPTLQFQQNGFGGPFHGKVGPRMRLIITTLVLNMATENRLFCIAYTVLPGRSDTSYVNGKGEASNTSLSRDIHFHPTNPLTSHCVATIFKKQKKRCPKS